MSKSKRRNRYGKTFRETVEELAVVHAQAIFSRAQQFNRIAKSARRYGQRQLAYRFKNRCLGHLLSHCSQYAYAIPDDIVHDDPGLILVKLPGMGGLHSHSRWLDAA